MFILTESWFLDLEKRSVWNLEASEFFLEEQTEEKWLLFLQKLQVAFLAGQRESEAKWLFDAHLKHFY